LTIAEVLEKVVHLYERHVFWLGVREDFARLQSNQAEWEAYKAEMLEWDTLAGDGPDKFEDGA
jgi:hypothetical protein